jgi:hypothetical protein
MSVKTLELIKHMNTIKLFMISCLLVAAIGCASITRGSKDTLVVNSDPSGAKVSLSIGLSGKTPCAFKVSTLII